MAFQLMVHGGCSSPLRIVTDSEQELLREGLRKALEAGNAILKSGGTALDAVERAVCILEDDPVFNAGCGGVLNRDGRIELEASIMEGHTLRNGLIHQQHVRNPVSLARVVMEKTEHTFMAAPEAELLAQENGLQLMEESYFHTEKRQKQWEAARAQAVAAAYETTTGTVGAVARDRYGHLAAATSTGGRVMKLPGRIGDTPLIGAGCYANNYACISCTGTGEEFIRHHASGTIAARVELLSESAKAAATALVDKLDADVGGAIVIDHHGNFAAVFNTTMMMRGVAGSDIESKVALWASEKWD